MPPEARPTASHILSVLAEATTPLATHEVVNRLARRYTYSAEWRKALVYDRLRALAIDKSVIHMKPFHVRGMTVARGSGISCWWVITAEGRSRIEWTQRRGIESEGSES